MTPTYYIIAGEPSGDLHGSNLIKALRLLDSNCEIRFWGGDLMAKASNEDPVKHYNDLAYMGLVEVIEHLPEIFSNLKFCKKDILNHRPNALILIDYPGFNLRIAKWAHQQGINVQYYISPKIWAWNTSRVHKIKSTIDNMYVILPFEKEFYSKFNYDVTYVGNPLLDEIKCFSPDPQFTKRHLLKDKKILALLPGSRKQELRNSIPIMIKMIDQFPDFHFCIAKVPSIDKSFYIDLMANDQDFSQLRFVENDTYNLLHYSDLALVTSGTATLETALFRTPQVVCYKTSALSYFIGKLLIKVKYLSLVNLILDKPVVEELIQNEFNAVNLKEAILRLCDQSSADIMMKEYDHLIAILGTDGAATLVAKSVLESISIKK